ncbi:hypothetical protein M569_00657, partial [Genlisea aurea]
VELNPNSTEGSSSKCQIVVIMGPTGSGKSKLAIDIAAHFPVEIINADSMQVYEGLDILTNKVPDHEQQGVPHHLLGTVSSNVEFNSKDFRDSAMLLIDELSSRDKLPVVVGGTNYYIQALVSRFLLDDQAENQQETDTLLDDPVSEELDLDRERLIGNDDFSFSRLRELDPVAANRVHPNNQRKIKQYLRLFSWFGALPSKLLGGQVVCSSEWGKIDRYDCCFICLDASLPELDDHVNRRVDLMVSSGLFKEVYGIYDPDSDYSRGLRQAIGVREFEDVLLRFWNSEKFRFSSSEMFSETMLQILNSSAESYPKRLLQEAIDRVKMNTRRLVRIQKRRINQLQSLFDWNVHYIDVTSCLSRGDSDNLWRRNVVEPAVDIIASFLTREAADTLPRDSREAKHGERDLWTRRICQACRNKELRGAHEWEQHIKGSKHRKRVSSLRRTG